MVRDERVALLGLLVGSGERWATIADRVEESGSACQVLDEMSAGQQSLFGPLFDTGEWTDRARQLLDEWSDEGIKFASLLDEDYPAQLRNVHQHPPFITWIGEIVARDRHGVAIVGTREATPRGVSMARALAMGLVGHGVTVVSGLAAGIDTAAHQGALDTNGRTVAVIGTGLRIAYPKQNAALQAEIGRRGMVLSQFLPDSPPTRASFPMRNAVMSAFSSATLVIEAGFKSGARLQARLACEQGRMLMLHEGLRSQEWAVDLSSRPGACFVETLDDVLGALERWGPPSDSLSDE